MRTWCHFWCACFDSINVSVMPIHFLIRFFFSAPLSKSEHTLICMALAVNLSSQTIKSNHLIFLPLQFNKFHPWSSSFNICMKKYENDAQQMSSFFFVWRKKICRLKKPHQFTLKICILFTGRWEQTEKKLRWHVHHQWSENRERDTSRTWVFVYALFTPAFKMHAAHKLHSARHRDVMKSN